MTVDEVLRQISDALNHGGDTLAERLDRASNAVHKIGRTTNSGEATMLAIQLQMLAREAETAVNAHPPG